MHRISIAVALALFGLASPAMSAETTVPKELHGTYAPAGNCAKEPRVVADPTGVYVDAAGKRTSLGPMDVCFSCVGGAQYSGIEVWASPVVRDMMPLVLRFNADEKRGALIGVENEPKLMTPLYRSVVAAGPMRKCAAR